MQIVVIPIGDLTPYEKNAKVHTKEQIKQIKISIEKFGMNDPIGIWGDKNIIIEGHGRWMALKELGYEEVDCIRLDHLSDEERKAYALAHNKLTMNTDFDFDLLQEEIELLSDFDMSEFGFEEVFENPYDRKENGVSGSLAEKYIVPPYSVLDSKQGYWKDRKEEWRKIITSGNGRGDELLGKGLKSLAEKTGSTLTGTSIFDPVLCEVLVNWFCPSGGKVIDPFAGGSVRGLVSAMIGNDYTGVDLSKKQIEANEKNYDELKEFVDFNGDCLKKPNWINGDSAKIDELVQENDFDFMLTCPPYADLEVYSDDPADISNMPYDEFKSVYFDIIKKTVDKLKENAFAAIVVGDVRDKKGYYYNFVGHTKDAFLEAGCKLYNECILVESGATAALRAGKQFNAGRKVVKTHQNVLIFIKGNEKKIELKPYNYDFSLDINE